MTLYFHDLQPAPEGSYLVSRPLEVAEELDRYWSAFMTDEERPVMPDVVAFIVEGPERSDRLGLMVRRDLLDGTPEENADAIRRTMPDGWTLRVAENTR